MIKMDKRVINGCLKRQRKGKGGTKKAGKVIA